MSAEKSGPRLRPHFAPEPRRWIRPFGAPLPYCSGDPVSADIFYEVYDTLDPDCGLVVEHTRTMRLIGSCFVHPRPTHVSVIEGDNDIEGFLVTCDHPGLNIMGPGAARREEQAAILIHRELNRYRGRQPLFIVPVDCGNLARMLYGWGARNCELHVSQVRGEAVPSRGVIMPTFLPESA